VTIGALPDYVLLEVFNFYVDDGHCADIWHTLVHVCQRWRYLVFASPRRLNLQILCTNRRPVREMLDIWPALPIFVMWDDSYLLSLADNILAALNHRERVCRIDFWQVGRSAWESCARAMQEPFPKLTELALRLNDEADELEAALPFPDSFLGGTGPRLRFLDLDGVPFPALGKLLLSTKDLVTLRLWNIPHSGYIPPVTMLACLFAMTKLETLRLGFRSRTEGESQRQPQTSLARGVLPSLTRLQFKGASEYLEDLISRIDAPLLDDLTVAFLNQPIFNIPQLLRFIDRPKNFETFDEAVMIVSKLSAEVKLHQRAGTAGHTSTRLGLEILCRESDLQLSSLAQACTTSLSPLSTVERLEIFALWQPYPHGGTKNAQWLAILRPFTAVKDLYVSEGLISHIPFALQDLVGERVTEVLPALRNLYLRGLPLSGTARIAVETFVTARKRSGHPVTAYRLKIDDASDQANLEGFSPQADMRVAIGMPEYGIQACYYSLATSETGITKLSRTRTECNRCNNSSNSNRCSSSSSCSNDDDRRDPKRQWSTYVGS